MCVTNSICSVTPRVLYQAWHSNPSPIVLLVSHSHNHLASSSSPLFHPPVSLLIYYSHFSFSLSCVFDWLFYTESMWLLSLCCQEWGKNCLGPGGTHIPEKWTGMACNWLQLHPWWKSVQCKGNFQGIHSQNQSSVNLIHANSRFFSGFQG